MIDRYVDRHQAHTTQHKQHVGSSSNSLCNSSLFLEAMVLFHEAFKSSYVENKPKFFWWYPEGTSRKEKQLLTKIDFFILTYCCLGYFAKWLDRVSR